LKDNRADIIGACRRQATLDGQQAAGYDHLIAFVHEPPVNSGTSGADAVLDQSAVLLERYHQHIGRLIGFRHAPSGDESCVMGHLHVAAPGGVAVLPGIELWGGRRELCAECLRPGNGT
jgi:hypothetical protein